jgi:hypothetical protein
MPLTGNFFDDAQMYIYDADPDRKAQMDRSTPFEDHVIVAAVGGVDGEADFHVNYDSFTSSLKKPNPVHAGIFYQDTECDYLLGDVLKPLKTIKVSTMTLGRLAKENSFQVDDPSLDVQGVEFELLTGVSDALFRDMVGIMCETSLFQFYERQKLFDEIVAPLLFLRDPQHVIKHARRPFLSLLKLAFISMCYGNVAYALHCLEEAYKNPDGKVLAAKEKISYDSFLDDMYRLYRAEDHIYPPRFSHLLSAEESLARFKVDTVVNPDKEAARRAYFSECDQEKFFRMARSLLDPRPTEFEELLEKHGFKQLTNRVRERRVASIRQTLTALSMQVVKG